MIFNSFDFNLHKKINLHFIFYVIYYVPLLFLYYLLCYLFVPQISLVFHIISLFLRPSFSLFIFL